MGRKVILLLSAVSLFAVACGDSDSGSTGGSAGTTGAAGSGSGTFPYACYTDKTKSCMQIASPTAGSAESGKSGCTMGGGVASEKCPAADLVGCCVATGTSGTCYYTAANHDPMTLPGACANGGGKWQTTVP